MNRPGAASMTAVRVVKDAPAMPGSTADALRRVREALQGADPSDATVRAIAAVLALSAAREPVAPVTASLMSVAEAARACGRSKVAMVKLLRRTGIGEKAGGRWYVARAALRDRCPEFLG